MAVDCKWVGMGGRRWEWMAVGRSGCSGWKYMKVGESGREWVRVDGSRWEWVGPQFSITLWYSHMMKNFEIRIFVIILNTTFNTYTLINISRFFLLLYDVLWHLLTISCSSSKKYFLMQQSYASKFCFSEFWLISQQQQTFLCCVYNIFQCHCHATWSIVKLFT